MIKEIISAIMKPVMGVFLVIIILGLVGLIMGYPVMWIWNWLMPDLFDFKTITFWQAFWLNFLCGLLFNKNGSSSGDKNE